MDSTTLRDRPILRATAALAVACLLPLIPATSAGAAPLMPRSVGAITITLTRHPGALSNSGQATFDWRTSGIIGETRCKLDSAAYTFCPGIPSRYGGLSEGRHHFTVRVRNGYQVTAKATWTWTIDTTAPTVPAVSGGSASWRNAGSGQITAAGSADSGSGLAGYQWRAETEGGTWSAAVSGAAASVKAQGTSYVQFRSVDKAGNVSAWQPTPNGIANMVRLDRTAPTAPTVTGGSLLWQGVASVTLNGSGSTDALSGVDHYQYRTSTDGGITWSAAVTGTSLSVTAAGTTLVQFRATDVSGLRSAWAPSPAAAGGTVNIDRTAPSAPAVTGGSLGWHDVPSVTVSATGGSDTGGAGLATPQYRTSTDGGTTWSGAVTAASLQVTAEGETLVQFRNADAAGNTSAWAPAAATAGNTVRLDRTAPSAPAVSGGSLTCAGTRTISATGSTDGSGSGVSRYEYEVSGDGGQTYGSATTGHTVTFTTSGSYVVQFRAVDAVGLASAWAPLSPGAANTACIS
jgi:hypothetical protein